VLGDLLDARAPVSALDEREQRGIDQALEQTGRGVSRHG
jgi:hypothetical protein